MSTEDALLAAVRSAPDDDLPRLVYADWLEENGDADRAEFIRVQIEQARLRQPDTRLHPPVGREQELLERNAARWREPVAGWLRIHPFQVRYRRGFVEAIELRNRGHWRPAGLTDFLHFPLAAVNSLTVSSNDGDHLEPQHVHDLFDRPEWEHLTSLGFAELGDVSPEAVATLVTCPNLPRLTHLTFWACTVGTPAVRALAGHVALSRVRRLTLTRLHLRDEAVATLAAGSWVAQLTALDLGGNSFITDVGATALANSPHLSGLTSLNLAPYADRITEAGRAALRRRFGDRVTV
jgi:uncharacterized protein (TIGR02996 family)